MNPKKAKKLTEDSLKKFHKKIEELIPDMIKKIDEEIAYAAKSGNYSAEIDVKTIVRNTLEENKMYSLRLYKKANIMSINNLLEKEYKNRGFAVLRCGYIKRLFCNELKYYLTISW